MLKVNDKQKSVDVPHTIHTHTHIKYARLCQKKKETTHTNKTYCLNIPSKGLNERTTKLNNNHSK